MVVELCLDFDVSSYRIDMVSICYYLHVSDFDTCLSIVCYCNLSLSFVPSVPVI